MCIVYTTPYYRGMSFPLSDLLNRVGILTQAAGIHVVLTWPAQSPFEPYRPEDFPKTLGTLHSQHSRPFVCFVINIQPFN